MANITGPRITWEGQFQVDEQPAKLRIVSRYVENEATYNQYWQHTLELAEKHNHDAMENQQWREIDVDTLYAILSTNSHLAHQLWRAILIAIVGQLNTPPEAQE